MLTFTNSKNSLFNIDQSIISTQTTIDMLNGRITIMRKGHKKIRLFIIIDLIMLLGFAPLAIFEFNSSNHFSGSMYSISSISLTFTIFYLKHSYHRTQYYLNSLQNSLDFYVNNMNELRNQDTYQIRKDFDDLIE